MQSKNVLSSFALLLTIASTATGVASALIHAPAYAQSSITVGKKHEITRCYREKRKHWYTPHLRGQRYFQTVDENGLILIHSEQAFKKYKKQLRRDGIILKDARPYEEQHPICNKVQVGCQRWLPVAQFSSQFMVPGALAAAGVVTGGENKQTVVVNGTPAAVTK